jgi:hypothetical protein
VTLARGQLGLTNSTFGFLDRTCSKSDSSLPTPNKVVPRGSPCVECKAALVGSSNADRLKILASLTMLSGENSSRSLYLLALMASVSRFQYLYCRMAGSAHGVVTLLLLLLGAFVNADAWNEADDDDEESIHPHEEGRGNDDDDDDDDESDDGLRGSVVRVPAPRALAAPLPTKDPAAAAVVVSRWIIFLGALLVGSGSGSGSRSGWKKDGSVRRLVRRAMVEEEEHAKDRAHFNLLTWANHR